METPIGQPVVTTILGSQGVICENDKNILIGNDSRSFSDHILRLLDDKQLCAELGKEGRKNIIENYSWDKVVERFNEILLSLPTLKR